MARDPASILDANDMFPEMNLILLSGETLALPRDFGEGYGVLLIYRGYW